MRASTTAFRSAAGTDGWTNARHAFSCRRLDEDGLACGQPARPAGGHQAGGQSRVCRPPDGYRRRNRRSNSRLTTSPSSSRRPPIAMQRPTPSPIHSCSSSSVKGGEPQADDPRARTPGRSPASRPTAHTLLAVLEVQGSRRLQRVSRLAAFSWPEHRQAPASSPTASIAR